MKAIGGELVHVPRGHLWIEGDNEAASNDSNGFGCVAAGLVGATVRFKLWPVSEAGVVHRVEPAAERVPHRSRVDSMAGAVSMGQGMLPWHVR